MQSKQVIENRDLSDDVGRLKANYNLLRGTVFELGNELKALADAHNADYDQIMAEIKYLNNRVKQLEELIKKFQDRLEKLVKRIDGMDGFYAMTLVGV